jgi:hypothetical protein
MFTPFVLVCIALGIAFLALCAIITVIIHDAKEHIALQRYMSDVIESDKRETLRATLYQTALLDRRHN